MTQKPIKRAYIIAGFVRPAWIALPIALVLMVGTLFAIRAITARHRA